MSDISEDSTGAVLVEHDDAPELIDMPDQPVAVNVVSIGSEQDAFAFEYHEDRINQIFSKIPQGTKVALVSVVGAFRTGKSFLLSWFLRYLNSLSAPSSANQWYAKNAVDSDSGFHWKAGTERDTTGIWMWSDPHIIKRNGEELAVLLVDTQGMFDHETTMSLTASIFGFSTLLSSYQIYNVDKRIQEDNLQQLALFSEYAKTAVASDGEEKDGKPFQRMEFLLRDWQHFEDGDDDDPSFEDMEKSMEKYLEKVIAERDAKDLKDTREQIVSCFEEISCYGLCHPGFAVTKKKFKGDVADIEDQFLQLLDRYCKRVFGTVEAKEIHGRSLTAAELKAYIRAYAELFKSGAKFPEAATLLEATASTNNTNAVNVALAAYQTEMDRIAGPTCTNYVNPEELSTVNKVHEDASLEVFASIANFGSSASIETARKQLQRELDKKFDVYNSLNDGRDPLKGVEVYMVPAVVAFAAGFLRWLTDMTCSPYATVCKHASDFFSHTSWVVTIFILLVAATKYKQIKDAFTKFKAAFDAMSDNKAKKD